MRRLFLSLFAIGAIALCSSCNKPVSCRCSVLGTQYVRIVEITSGSCEDLRYVRYDASVIDTNVVDSIVCTDFLFDADSVFNQ